VSHFHSLPFSRNVLRMKITKHYSRHKIK
jgi:hypothetical protein